MPRARHPPRPLTALAPEAITGFRSYLDAFEDRLRERAMKRRRRLQEVEQRCVRVCAALRRRGAPTPCRRHGEAAHAEALLAAVLDRVRGLGAAD